MSVFKDVPKIVWTNFYLVVDTAELEYVDNGRAYRVKDDFLKEEYLTAKSEGCCGFFDTVIFDDIGDEWMVGCNHGH